MRESESGLFVGVCRSIQQYSGASTMSSNRFCFYHCVPTSGGFAVSIHDKGSFCLFVSLTGLCEQLEPPFTYQNDDIFANGTYFLGGGFKYFFFHPYLGKWSNLTNIFQMGCNHQLVLRYWGTLETVQVSCRPYPCRFCLGGASCCQESGPFAAVSQQMLENPVSFKAATLCQLWTSGRRGTAEWWKLDWCTLHLCPRGAFVAGDLSIT